MTNETSKRHEQAEPGSVLDDGLAARARDRRQLRRDKTPLTTRVRRSINRHRFGNHRRLLRGRCGDLLGNGFLIRVMREKNELDQMLPNGAARAGLGIAQQHDLMRIFSIEFERLPSTGRYQYDWQEIRTSLCS